MADRAVFWILLGMVGACTRWEPYPVAPDPASTLPASLRVWSPDRAGTVLTQPSVRRDMLYGRSGGDTLEIPLSTIQRLARPRLDAVRTVGAVGVGLVAWAAVGLVSGGLN